jgi:glutamate-1-semialdehyde 2,1-aminomutase
MQFDRSRELYEEAQNVLVGGVDSPVRAFKSVGGSPIFAKRGEGAYIYDADDNKYIDYVGSYGPLILGHADRKVNEAVKAALDNGATFGASSEAEIRLAELVIEAFPSIEKVRFVNSGTEAVMSAIRLARGFTGRSKIIKFAGNYHGHSDFLLAQAGSGLATLSLPGSAGVPEATVKDTIIAPYNDMAAIEEIFRLNKDQVAAIIVEPVCGNIGVVLPQNDFLSNLRKITKENGSLLIFDEVMTGFRQNFGGVQKFYNITPDITCLGKVIGGGMPVGAYGARKEIMDMVAPLGPVYQAGTLSGNPIAMTAGIHTLQQLKDEKLYDRLNQNTEQLAEGIREIAQHRNIAVQVATFGSMITPFFCKEPIHDYASALKSDTQKFAKFFWALIHNGVYVPPSQFEAWFVSARHGQQEIQSTLEAVDRALSEL